MIRNFLALAVTGTSLLLADFVLGLLAAGEPRGPHAIWHAIHLLFSLVTVIALLAVHSIVYTYFMATASARKLRIIEGPETERTGKRASYQARLDHEQWSSQVSRARFPIH